MSINARTKRIIQFNSIDKETEKARYITFHTSNRIEKHTTKIIDLGDLSFCGFWTPQNYDENIIKLYNLTEEYNLFHPFKQMFFSFWFAKSISQILDDKKLSIPQYAINSLNIPIYHFQKYDKNVYFKHIIDLFTIELDKDSIELSDREDIK